MLKESSVLLLLTSLFYQLCFQGDQQSWQYRKLLKAIKIHSFRKKKTVFIINRNIFSSCSLGEEKGELSLLMAVNS